MLLLSHWTIKVEFTTTYGWPHGVGHVSALLVNKCVLNVVQTKACHLSDRSCNFVTADHKVPNKTSSGA